jgi:5-methylcytosine-specific restriction endonuclease McrA
MRPSICKTVHTCVQCGDPFFPKRTTFTTCCSRACGHALNSAQARARGVAKREAKGWPFTPVRCAPCAHCQAPFYVRAKSSRACCSALCAHRIDYVKRNPQAYTERQCQGCGASFTPIYGRGGTFYCTQRCAKREARRRLGSTTHRARARKAGVRYEAVDPLDIMRRDRWTCQICKRPAPQKLRGTTDPRAPELDHIVPFALKGPHTAANLQCACRSCNLSKGAQWQGQRRLFG